MSYFPTTHWSLVIEAGHGSVETAREALEQLCRTYWYPLYAYSRAQGDAVEDAEDLVQGFLAELIEKNLVAKADFEKGRFRSFLLQSFKYHRFKQREKMAAVKRGAGVTIVSLDALQAEERFAGEPQDGLTPERQFDRTWAVSVLDEAHRRLAAEYDAAGKGAFFAKLRGVLQTTGDRLGYAGLAEELGKTEAAVKMEASRLRLRYRKLLRAVVAETVSHPGEVEEELASLLAVLRS